MSRSVLILKTTVILLLCSSAAGISHLWKQEPLTLEVFGVGLLVPIVTSALFLCVSVAVPELYASARLRFPITVTLPLIHTGTLLVTAILLSKVGLSISKIPDRLSSIYVWFNPWLLFVTFITGFACLSAVGALARDKGER